jgi:hypothetical protein
MSVEAITWALGIKVDRSTAKFVLVAMANCANSDMTCWPSIQYLSDATCQDRKTVLENTKRLKEAGLIVDTDLRKGRTGQVVVYQLKNTENGTTKEPRKRNSPENGTVPKTDGNSPVFPAKQSRFSAETDPKTGHGTVMEPPIEPSINHEENFEILWKSFSGVFGERGNKAQAETEFKKIKPDSELFTEMIQAVDYQHRVKQAQTQAGAFCSNFKHVERWLKKKSWKDDFTLQQAAPPKILNDASDRTWAGE